MPDAGAKKAPEKSLPEALGNAAGIAAWMLMFVGVAIWNIQIFDWLRKGEWQPMTFGFLMRKLSIISPDGSFGTDIEWKGIQKIVFWLLGLNAGAGLFVVAMFLLVLMNILWAVDEHL